MNIDATALFLEFPFKDIMEELQNIWITLKNAVCGQKNRKKSGKKKLKTANGTSGNQISDLHAVAEDEISMMFTLELKLYNFIQQWMIISQYFANDPHSETFKIDKDSLFQFITLQLTKSHAERLLECYKQTQPKKATITFAAVVPVPTTPVLPNDSAIKYLFPSHVPLFPSSFALTLNSLPLPPPPSFPLHLFVLLQTNFLLIPPSLPFCDDEWKVINFV